VLEDCLRAFPSIVLTCPLRAIRRLSLFACVLAFPFVASALTVMSRGDLRRWETVTDRSRPLSWPWEADSESATLTFSNRLTQSVSSLTVVREPGALRGSCPHPVPASADDALVAATLEQWAGGVAISRETAELAYVSGASGRAITVRTKADRNWYRVERPCVAAFDAGWWNVAGRPATRFFGGRRLVSILSNEGSRGRASLMTLFSVSGSGGFW